MNFRRELAAKVMAGEKTVTRRLASDNPKSPWWIERTWYQPGKVFTVNPGRGKTNMGDGVVLTCGCAPKYLTSVSVPVTAEDAVKQPCPCCGAAAGKRCTGGTAGWLDDARTRAWVDVCPGRLEVQRSLL